MTRLRMSGRQKALLAVALGLLLWAPSGISQEQTPIVTGHSTFYNGDSYDPCLASIAGIMRSRVMWFNDQVLVERYGGKGTFIYATQYGAEDPRTKNYLYSEGIYYDFTDPNGAHWHVEEAFYSKPKVTTSTATTPPDPQDGDFPQESNADISAAVHPDDPSQRTYVWFVELSANPIFDEFHGADPHRYYNFLNLIDTCKFNRERLGEEYIGVEHHDYLSGTLNADNGHPNGEREHDHEKFIINLWVGTRPTTVPFGELSTNPSSWESSWAAQYPEQEAAEAEYQANQTIPDGFEESLP